MNDSPQRSNEIGLPDQQMKLFMSPPNSKFSPRRKKTRHFETLEARYVLDSTVVFNELMYNPNETASESLRRRLVGNPRRERNGAIVRR
jgi:hypothetical protein